MSEELEKRYILCHNGGGGCHYSCGLIAYVDKKTGEIVKTEANPDALQNMGVLCHARGIVPNFTGRLLNHPDQLKYPLKRVGERGEGKWEQISYEQALDEIAEKLLALKEEYGPESLAFTEGTMRTDHGYVMRHRFAALYGNPQNVADPGTICGRCLQILDMMHVGSHCTTLGPSAEGGLMVTGSNRSESFPIVWMQMLEAQEEGTKLIILDPRLTESARKADEWMQLRPGTDSAIFLCWLNIIIEEDLIDRQFLEEWTNAPFLIRTDTHKLLTESDVVKGGSPEKYMVYDPSTKTPKPYNCETRQYEPSNIKPSITGGPYSIKLGDGQSVECKTAWEMVVERVSQFTPEEVEEISWVPAEQIIRTARMYGTLKPAGFIWGEPTDAVGRGSMNTERARLLLGMATGNIDLVGGTEIIQPGVIYDGKLWIRDSIMELQDAMTPEQKAKMIGADFAKVMTWPGFDAANEYYKKTYGIPHNASGHGMLPPAPLVIRAILDEDPYPVKSLITWSSNALLWMPNTKLVYQALKSPKLELHVVLEHWMTPTAELADYVLPASIKCIEYPYISAFEDLMNNTWVSDSALDEPIGERRSEFQFFKGLADRMGFGEYFPWKDNRELVEWRIKPLGITLEEAAKQSVLLGDQYPYEEPGYLAVDDPYYEAQHEKADGTWETISRPKTGKPRGFATPTGRAELWPVILENLGYDPIPDYVEPPESPISTPEVAEEYPLILSTGGRFAPMFHSENRQWGIGFREQHPDPICDIHTETARDLGISNGDWVWIETRRGRIIQRARVSTSILPGCVNCEASWWFPELPGEEPWLHGLWISNANVLTLDEPDTLDPLVGAWDTRALLCKVYKSDGITPHNISARGQYPTRHSDSRPT